MGHHGDVAVTQPERLFIVDVTIHVDLAAVSRTDSYADVVDLADLAASIRWVVCGPPRLLLETVAVQTARLLLERYPTVHRVDLRLIRPEPPDLDAAAELVEVSLDRPS
jgi:dihydroneopterin aldolase